MKINAISILSAAYALYKNRASGDEDSDAMEQQRAAIEAAEPYYQAIESGETYHPLEQSSSSYSPEVSISWSMNLGKPGPAAKKYSMQLTANIKNDGSETLSVVAVRAIPTIGGQFGDTTPYSMPNYVDRSGGYVLAPGETATIVIKRNYLDLSKDAAKKIAEKLCSVFGWERLQNKTATGTFTCTFGVYLTKPYTSSGKLFWHRDISGSVKWMGKNYYPGNSDNWLNESSKDFMTIF